MDDGLTSSDLIELAATSGYPVTERQLEEWRAEKYLPPTRRLKNEGRRPVWVHPPEAPAQLLALLKLREETRNPDLLRVALWYQGYAVPIDAVRASMLRRLQLLVDELERTISADENNGVEADRLMEFAEELAGRRGKRSVGPRTPRMRRDERVQGLAYLLAMFLGDARAGDVGDAIQAERVLGLSWGRGGLGKQYKWIDSAPGEEAANLSGVLSLPGWLVAVSQASDGELLAARETSMALMTALQVVAMFLDATVGPSAAGLAAFKDPSPLPVEYVPFLVAFFLVMLRANTAGFVELAPVIGRAVTSRADFEAFVRLEPAEREKRLASVTTKDAITLRKMLQTYNEQLTAR
jgi:hypothetical protein